MDSIPKYLENFILEAEQLVDETMGEFLTTTTTTTTITTCNEENTDQLGNDEDVEDIDSVINTAMGITPVPSINKETAAETNTTTNTTLQDGPMDVDDDDDNNNDEAK